LDVLHHGPADRLAVIDRKGTRLQTFTLDGRPLASVVVDPAGDGAFQLSSCAFDYYGHLVATDKGRGSLRKYDRDLKPLAVYGEQGEGDYRFLAPRGICISKQLGQMVVSEESSVQYMWVGADALNLRAENNGGTVTFRFYLTEPAYLTADVVTEAGVKVARVADNVMMDERERVLVWTPPEGTVSGPYRLDLSVMATYSSRERLAKAESLPFSYQKTVAAAPQARSSPTALRMAQGAGAGTKDLSGNGARTLGQALSESRKTAKLSTTPTPYRTLGQAMEAVRTIQNISGPEPVKP
jgi:hypothetical protein